MQSITDVNDETWDLKLDAGATADKILSLTGVDILEPEEHVSGIYSLYTRSRIARKVVWILVEDQATAKEIKNESEFFSRFHGMTEVMEALGKEVRNFIQNTSRVALVRLEESEKATKNIENDTMVKLKSEELHRNVSEEVREILQEDVDRVREKIRKAVATAGGSGPIDKLDSCEST